MRSSIRPTLLQRVLAMRLSTAAQMLLSLAVMAWAAMAMHLRLTQAIAPSSLTVSQRTRVVLRLEYGSPVMVRWTDHDVEKLRGWFSESPSQPAYTVSLRSTGGTVERAVCSDVRSTSCVMPKLKPCKAYEISVFRSSETGAGAGARMWKQFVAPAAANGQELFCKRGWQPLLGGFKWVGEEMVLGESCGGSAAMGGGASQLVEVVGAVPVAMVRVSARVKSGNGVSRLLAELWYSDGSRSREVLLSLERANKSWWTASLVVTPEAHKMVSAVRLSLLAGGCLHLESLSVKRISGEDGENRELLLHRPPPLPAAVLPTFRVQTSKAPFVGWRNMLGIAVTLRSDQIASLALLAELWQAPVSAAVWLVGDGDSNSVISEVRSSYQAMQVWVDVHVMDRGDVERYAHDKLGTAPPINTLRNVAMSRSRSRYVLELDGGVLPSPQCRNDLMKLIAIMAGSWTAVVVPAFESLPPAAKESLHLPKKKSELLEQVEKRATQQYQVGVAPEAQAANDYYEWFVCESEYTASWRIGWQPFLLVDSHQVPLWDERLLAGKFDRASRAEALHALDYEFVVSCQAFVVFHGTDSVVAEVTAHAADAYASFRAGVQRRR